MCLENIKAGFDKISHEIENFDALYILDENGIQIEDSISLNEKYKIPKGEKDQYAPLPAKDCQGVEPNYET